MSSTVRRGKSRRFSGTCAIPRLTMRCGAVASTSVPSIAIEPLEGRIRPEITRISVVLPAPFGADHADRLARPDVEVDAEQRLKTAIARIDRPEFEHRLVPCPAARFAGGGLGRNLASVPR